MTTRVARVVFCSGPVELPDSAEQAWEVITDYPVAAEKAFWLKPGPMSSQGVQIAYGDHSASWLVDGHTVTARKAGYNHDPDDALR